MGQCNAERFRVNKLRMQRVAHYSFACLKEIAGAGLPIDFDFHQDGTLQLFRDEAGLKAVPGITRALDEFEVPWRFLEGPTRPASSRRWRTRARPSRARCSCRRTAPATAKFATGMSAYLQGQGVDFRYGVQIRRRPGREDALPASRRIRAR